MFCLELLKIICFGFKINLNCKVNNKVNNLNIKSFFEFVFEILNTICFETLNTICYL